MVVTLSLILWTRPIIYLAVFAAMALVNIIMSLTVIGGRFSRYAERAIREYIAKKEAGKSLSSSKQNCNCRCHTERASMFPGMRCVDCLGLDCDEGTKLAEEVERESNKAN